MRKKSVTNEEIYESWTSTPRDYYLTQMEIMKSRDYAERLVRVLNLTKHPAYDPRQQQVEKGWVASLLERFRSTDSEKSPPSTSAADANEESIKDGVVSQVMGGISITQTRN